MGLGYSDQIQIRIRPLGDRKLKRRKGETIGCGYGERIELGSVIKN